MPGRFPSDHNHSFSQSSSHSQRPGQGQGQGQETDPMRRSTSNRSSNPNVFSDDYSLEPIDSEQTTLTPSNQSVSSFTSSSTLRSAHVPPKPATTPTSEREATENPFGDDARVSFEDSFYRSSLPPKGIDYSRNSRSQSNSSRFSIPPRALSPYTGATGPSHPYAMYPQVGVSRSPSVTTTSTMRPADRPLGDASAPQHPYAMYPQNVVLEEGMDDGTIPLGFPGHNQTYQVAPGRADDDVGDLVGPDGHTEQLPPYTRYPDGVVPKVEGSFEAATNAGIIEDSPPSQQEGPPDSEDIPRTTVTQHPPAEPRQPPEETPTGVMAFEEKLKTKGKKKACCGLPVWTLVLVCVVILVVACIGGIIGGVLGARKAASDEQKKAQQTQAQLPDIVTVTATPSMDATPITSTPPHLSSLPTGTYVIPASSKNQSKFCVADTDFRSSWGCTNKGNIPINIEEIDSLHGSISFHSDPYSGSFTYGAQAPYLPSPTQSMSMVQDTNDVGLGPALFFMTSFDKLVIVPQDAFPSSAVSKRNIPEHEIPPRAASSRKVVANAGDKPWFCWWNSTVLEFFLYVNETTNESLYGSTTLTDDPTSTESGGSSTIQTTLPDYPRRIKIEERRDYPDIKSPYCQQMSVLSDGSVVTASPSTVNIKEVEPTPTTTQTVDAEPTPTYTAVAQYQSACYCVSLTD
ncbi:hypothetical protein PHISCL_06733 [Aspergillus sclerotialis]|uniref:DUF7820 domain-containing protein n=1 Tax=Aspergillus sclerotialis TaxID=2070753 RepID=A0A3A2ZEA8_9EURO|nr:hypothetical protein PHISCL_06733 [Aspergillus sclerotialis]